MVPRVFAHIVRWWCLLAWLLTGAMAAELTEPPRVDALSSTSVVIRWSTEVPTGTRVHYGLEPNRLTKTAEGGVTSMHEITLIGLQPNASYFYSVGTARKLLATGRFTMSASPASNSSPASSSPIAKIQGLFNRWMGSDAPAPAANPVPAMERVPGSRQTWGNPASLADHFERHGADFGAKSADEYAAQAWQFRQRARAGELLVKIDEEGVQRVFDPATRAFAAYNPDGTTRTFFKPGRTDYFDRQPGRKVRTATP